MPFHRRALLLFAALLFAPSAGWPQGPPLGPEFRVNTYTTGNQGRPFFSAEHLSVASDSSGNFVVVWSSSQDPAYGIFGQRFVLISTVPDDHEITRRIRGDGRVILAVRGQDGSGHGVFGQRYSMIVPVELMRFGIE
jgi:hypothetical protein